MLRLLLINTNLIFSHFQGLTFQGKKLNISVAGEVISLVFRYSLLFIIYLFIIYIIADPAGLERHNILWRVCL